MSGGTDLGLLLASAAPVLAPGDYVFVTVREFAEADQLDPISIFREDEAVTVICTRQRAENAGLRSEGIYRQITLQVHSALEAVGFLATIATALAAAGIPCNAVAAYYHDHLFVPAERAEQAIAVLAALFQKDRSPNDKIAADFRDWLSEAYRVGEQKHLKE